MTNFETTHRVLFFFCVLHPCLVVETGAMSTTAAGFASDVLRCLDADTIRELSAVFLADGGLGLESFVEVSVEKFIHSFSVLFSVEFSVVLRMV